MDDRLHVLGVRHHGPGSAALVRAALDRLDPAVVLIEGAPEGDALVPYAAHAGMKPPVAMLFYAAEDARAAIFAPFAQFSPEWQAMLWASSRQPPVRFIDWPAAVSLALMKSAADSGSYGAETARSARDLALWQKKVRLKPEDLETEIRLDLRTEAGLSKSTLLHRLGLINIPWGTLIEADGGRGTFREAWRLSWRPEFSIALAEALVFGVTIEEAAGNATLDRAARTSSISELADLVRAALVADLAGAATAVIARLQEAAVGAGDITDLMKAISPLVAILRYGTARKMPEDALRALVTALAVEVNAGVRHASHQLDDDAARARLAAMRAYDEALGLFGDDALAETWRRQLALMLDDDQVAPAVAGLCLRRLHDLRIWDEATVAAVFSRHTVGQPASGRRVPGELPVGWGGDYSAGSPAPVSGRCLAVRSRRAGLHRRPPAPAPQLYLVRRSRAQAAARRDRQGHAGDERSRRRGTGCRRRGFRPRLANLRHYQAEHRTIVPETLIGFARKSRTRAAPWRLRSSMPRSSPPSWPPFR
jgi:hypothetical protein